MTRKLVSHEDMTIDLYSLFEVLEERREQDEEDARYEWLLEERRRGHYWRPRRADGLGSLACSSGSNGADWTTGGMRE